MKKIIIFGFPHCGTTILRAIIGHIPEVYEIIGETSKININESEIIKNNPEKKYILCKIPHIDKYFYTSRYNDYIKIFILRNPLWVFSSINKRFEGRKIFDNHNIPEYIKTCKLFIDKQNNKDDNSYFIKYEDLFNNNYQKLKDIFDKIGFNYTDDIFDNSKYTNYSHQFINDKNKNLSQEEKELIKKKVYSDKEHEHFRNMQINQPFINNNNIDKISLTELQINELMNDKYILELYPDILQLYQDYKNLKEQEKLKEEEKLKEKEKLKEEENKKEKV